MCMEEKYLAAHFSSLSLPQKRATNETGVENEETQTEQI